jgi:hyaluronoglucosaminidase
MIDGDLSTFFWSNGAPGPGAEVRVDLGQSTEIGDIALLMGKTTSPNDYIHSGALEYSVDGSQWTELTRATTADVRATAPAGTKARYVRYRALTDNDFWLVVREFSVQALGPGRTELTVTGTPTPATGSSYRQAVDGNVETAYVASAAPVAGNALVATLSAPRALAGVTVLQRTGAVATAGVEVLVGGQWRAVGRVSGAYAAVDAGGQQVEAVRLVWDAATTAPQVAEIVPHWADTPR